MIIGFDARCLEEPNISGVGEYALEILKNLLEIDRENTYVVFSNSYRKIAGQNFGWLERYPQVKLKRFSFPNKILNFLFWYFSWPKIDRMIGKVDVFFAPNINFLSVGRNCPLVATFHDLSFERYPAYFDFFTQLWHHIFVRPRKIAQSAQRIIAVSKSTKQDLEEIYGIAPQKIAVIPHGISPDFHPIEKGSKNLEEIQKKYGLPEKFVFFLGNIEKRKNIGSIIKASGQLSKKFPGYKLVLAGNIAPEFQKCQKNKDIIFCGYIDRKDRPYVYNLAALFVYPSFFEGFGFPAIEAMACGTPVVTSHNSSLPEVAGNAAILIDPNRPDTLFQAIESILTDRNLSDKLVERGFEQIQKFSWEKCARKTLEIIKTS
ncbi:MAG: glycosyltransferase family 1 protein [Candidatus Moranbacteria bacterium]|nr:glycosyltransferase family 1 protein [Candidatus Moranbacteria bacterium]